MAIVNVNVMKPSRISVTQRNSKEFGKVVRAVASEFSATPDAAFWVQWVSAKGR